MFNTLVRKIAFFKQLCVDNQLNLTDNTTIHFKKYVYFIHEILKLQYPELIFGVLFAYNKHNTALTQTFFHVQQDFREYLRLFYKSDKGIQKRVKDLKSKIKPDIRH
jgi:hypothetical protein